MSWADDTSCGLALRVARDGEALASIIAQAAERELTMSRALHSILCSLHDIEWNGGPLPDDITPMSVADVAARKTGVLRTFVAEFGAGATETGAPVVALKGAPR